MKVLAFDNGYGIVKQSINFPDMSLYYSCGNWTQTIHNADVFASRKEAVDIIDRLTSNQEVKVDNKPDINNTLQERGSRYGEFKEHARITQNIKRAMQDSPNWSVLRDDQKECFEMLAHKLGRILNGDANYHDSYHDIIGYTKLVADTLIPDSQ